MASKDATLATSYILLLLMLVGFASSDFQQDRAECANQLVSLATCLPYVGGEAKAPTLDCCAGLKGVLQKSRKCLCVLIKDRDDPNLGLKINATLAATLPGTCHAPINVTECVDLLHLAPTSQDAKEFARLEELTKGAGTNTTTTKSAAAASGNDTSSKGTSAEVKSAAGGRAKEWLGVELVCGLVVLAISSLFV